MPHSFRFSSPARACRRIADRWPSPVADELVDEQAYAQEYAYGRELGAMELRIRELERQGVRERDMIFDLSDQVNDLNARIGELSTALQEARTRADERLSSKIARVVRGVSTRRDRA